MDSLTSHFQSTSRAQRARNDRIERGRITHRGMEDIHTHAHMQTRARTHSVTGSRGVRKVGEEEKADRRFSPGAVILRNKSSESLAVSYNMGLCRWATSIPIFIPGDIRRSRAVPPAPSARAPALACAQPALSQFYNQAALPLPTGD